MIDFHLRQLPGAGSILPVLQTGVSLVQTAHRIWQLAQPGPCSSLHPAMAMPAPMQFMAMRPGVPVAPNGTLAAASFAHANSLPPVPHQLLQWMLNPPSRPGLAALAHAAIWGRPGPSGWAHSGQPWPQNGPVNTQAVMRPFFLPGFGQAGMPTLRQLGSAALEHAVMWARPLLASQQISARPALYWRPAMSAPMPAILPQLLRQGRRIQSVLQKSAAEALAIPARPNQQPGEALTQKVSEKTTILDMVRWNTKPNIGGFGKAIVLGEAAAGNGKPEISLGLDLGRSMSRDERAHAESQGKQAAVNMLNNTIREYRLQGTAAEAHIQRKIAWLKQPRSRMTLQALGDMTKEVSEIVHAEAGRKLGASTAAREAGRMPMECMTHLASAVQQARSTATPEQRQRLSMAADAIMNRVLQHRLTFQETRDFMAQAEKDFQRSGLRDLSALAGKLRTEIPDPARAGAYQTRLHDNIYGRAMESVFMAELVHNPPANVKACMGKISTTLMSILSTQPLASQEAAALEMQEKMREERRSWQAQSPALERFINARSSREALIALKALLQAPIHTGIDCIAVPYLAVKLSACTRHSNGYTAEWMKGADRLYLGTFDQAGSRITEAADNPNRRTRKAGITMHHQPSIVKGPWMEAAMHPGDRYRPDLGNSSAEVRQALQHGIAYASGVSGSTNIIMHMVGAFKRRGIDIDARDAMLGTMMFINYDGGHSMHEALWVGNQLDRKLGLGLGMPGGDPKTFVSDYRQFIDSFPDRKGGEQLRAAAHRAWDATLAHFRQHSHYAQQDS